MAKNKIRWTGPVNTLIDRSFHPLFKSDVGLQALIIDSIAHAIVEAIDGLPPERIIQKWLKYNVKLPKDIVEKIMELNVREVV